MVFGLYGYAICISHHPLIHVFDESFPVHRLSLDLHSKPLGLETYVLGSILISLIIAVLSWNLDAKDVLNLKKYFTLRGSDGSPGSSASRVGR
jgi:hypothetical protein